MRNTLAITLLAMVLASCGAGEELGTAAVAAKAKAREAEEGKQLEAQTKTQVEQALAADQKKLEDADAANH